MNTKHILKIKCVFKDVLDKIDLRKYVLAEKITLQITRKNSHLISPNRSQSI